MKKLLIGAVVVLGVLGLLFVGLIYLASDHKIPTGQTGPEAEALRDSIERSVNVDGFRRLGAVEFTFVRENRRHFYDIGRRLAEVRFKEYVVQYDLRTYKYRAEKNGVTLVGAEAATTFGLAQKFHVNDVFWLNPFAHLRSPGVQLEKIGDQALLVRFPSGGVTPGDSYLIVTNTTGRPTHWKLWVSTLPIKGIEASFEKWETFPDDVQLSLHHHMVVADIDLADIIVYPAYPEPDRPDRFAALLAL